MGMAERTPNFRASYDAEQRRRGSRACRHDQERRLARPLGVDHTRHGDEERVGVGEKNAAAVIGRAGLPTKRESSL